MNALGRSKGGLTTKIHALTDGLGNLVDLLLTGGEVHDSTQALALIQGKEVGAVLADKGYDSDDIRRQILKQQAVPVIPPRSNRKEPIDYDKHLYKARHLIENFFSKIKHFRRVFSRFDKTPLSYLSFIQLATAIIWLR